MTEQRCQCLQQNRASLRGYRKLALDLRQFRDSMPPVTTSPQARPLFDCIAGGVVGAVGLIRLTSLAALVYGGALASWLPAGLALFLVGGALMTALAALIGTYRANVTAPQDAPSAVLAVVAAALVAGSVSDPEPRFHCVVAAIVVSSITTGLVMLLLGRLRLGNVVRFAPYPVVGGFLAGVAWLMVLGALRMQVGFEITPTSMWQLFEPANLLRWGIGAGFAVLLFIATRTWRHFAVVPGLLLGGLLIAHLLFYLVGWSVAEARAAGWLLGPFAEAEGLPLALNSLAAADWAAVLSNSGTLTVVAIASILALLLNASALELTTRRDLDLNRELMAVGSANILGGLGGAAAGFPSLSLTLLGRQLGGTGRLTGLAVAMVTAGALFIGTGWLAWLPTPIVGGVLLYIAIDMLHGQLWRSRREMPRQDWAVVVLMMVTITIFGVLAGVTFGLVAAVILFVVQYSRLGAIKLSVDGTARRSAVDRPLAQRRLLAEHGKQIHILRLHGYLFFGTADHLISMVRRRCEDPELPPLRWLVIDTALVHGLDSSVAVSIARLLQLGETRGFAISITGLEPQLRRELERGELDLSEATHLADELDQGLEWAEDALLESVAGSAEARPIELTEALAPIAEEGIAAERIATSFEQLELPAGEHLVRQGENSTELYYLESGEVTVTLEVVGGKPVRLRTLRAGTFVGELAWYLGDVRSASVVTDTSCRVHKLSLDALHTLEQRDAEAAAAFHRFMARFLAGRLVETNTTLQAMMGN